MNKELKNAQSFRVPKERVWEILISILKKYPLKTIDEKRGLIKTELLKVPHFWLAPHQKEENFSGYSSVLEVKLDYKKPYSKIVIQKTVYHQKGFISFRKKVPFHSLEEEWILYRVAKELQIRSFLEKVQ